MGEKHQEVLIGQLDRADFVIPFVSRHLLAFDGMMDLMDRQHKAGLRLSWIFISSCLWRDTLFKDIQCANHDQALLGLSKAKREQALAGISKRLRELLGKPAKGLQLEGGAGLLYGVPTLPAFYLAREELLQRLKFKVLDAKSTAVMATPMGIHGMGGIGKTTLATALALGKDIQQHFYDGIFWLTFGKGMDPFVMQQELYRQLTVKKPVFENSRQGLDLLRRLLDGSKVLLILDDIWVRSQAEALQVVGGDSRLLLTTRNLALVNQLGAEALLLEMLDENQAQVLLQKTSKRNTLPSINSTLSRACGYLPLAIAAVGAQLANKPDKAWERMLHRIEEADITRFHADLPGYPYDTLFKVFKVSFEDLKPTIKERYLDLAVFPEGTSIPLKVLQLWWQYEGFSKWDVEDWVDDFVSRSMAQLSDNDVV